MQRSEGIRLKEEYHAFRDRTGWGLQSLTCRNNSNTCTYDADCCCRIASHDGTPLGHASVHHVLEAATRQFTVLEPRVHRALDRYLLFAFASVLLLGLRESRKRAAAGKPYTLTPPLMVIPMALPLCHVHWRPNVILTAKRSCRPVTLTEQSNNNAQVAHGKPAPSISLSASNALYDTDVLHCRRSACSCCCCICCTSSQAWRCGRVS